MDALLNSGSQKKQFSFLKLEIPAPNSTRETVSRQERMTQEEERWQLIPRRNTTRAITTKCIYYAIRMIKSDLGGGGGQRGWIEEKGERDKWRGDGDLDMQCALRPSLRL